MKYLMWLLKAAIFFTLFAFALNNQQPTTVHFFFGTQWAAPLVLVVLAAFIAGLCVGILVMVPRWWMQRKAAHQAPPPAATAATADAPTAEAEATTPAPAYTPPTLHGL